MTPIGDGHLLSPLIVILDLLIERNDMTPIGDGHTMRPCRYGRFTLLKEMI